jgi:hypothetical protein
MTANARRGLPRVETKFKDTIHATFLCACSTTLSSDWSHSKMGVEQVEQVGQSSGSWYPRFKECEIVGHHPQTQNP